jgi:hypothetical protein
LNNISRKEDFKLNQAWNMTIRFLQLINAGRLNNTEQGRSTDGLPFLGYSFGGRGYNQG